MERYDQFPQKARARLRRPLMATWAGLWVERALRAFWPLLSSLALFGAWLFSGLAAITPLWASQFAFALATLAILTSAVLGVMRFRRPRRIEALARLDAALPGTPIAALSDAQVTGVADPASRAVWEAHLARMAEKLDAARAQSPRPELAPRDPFALRLIAATALVVALLFGVRLAGPGLSSMVPGAAPEVAQASWEGWIEPPAYTGKPTLYLNDQPTGDLTVPDGSRVTLRLYGKVDEITISETWSDETPTEPLPTRLFTIDGAGTLTINDDNWQITALDDAAPAIEVTGDLTRTLAGEMQQGFTATDDYGVATGRAQFDLDLPEVEREYGLTADPEPRDPIVVDLPMPFRGSREEVEELLVENFAEHPWAEMPVTVTMTAVDAAGQTGQSDPVALTLPGRRFLNPIAQAIIEMRRDILWTMDNAPRAARILRAVSHAPEGFFPKSGQAEQLRATLAALETDGLNSPVRDEVAQSLWDLAIELEEGALADALERLRRAQDRLQEAMEQGATPEELSELMNELREAMRDYMNQLAEQSRENGEQQQAQNGETMEMSQQDLQEMMDRIEELMREGRMEEAQQMLQMLQQMMENMQVTQGQGQQGQNPGQQAMRDLQDTLRDQRDLSDETFRDQQGQQPGQQGQQGQQEGQQGQGDQQGQPGQGQQPGQEPGQGQGQNEDQKQGMGLAERQQMLENQLRRQRDNLPGAGTEEGRAAREALDRAGRAMDDAADALEQGDNAGALDRQADAMEEMREGMRNLEDALRREAQDGQDQQQAGGQGEQRGGPDGRDRRDPLGREAGDRGALGSDSPLADGDDVYRRAEELMEELRRRSGETERPELEREYVERLLDLF